MDLQEQFKALLEEKLQLEAALRQGDYKVIKCAEASLVKAEMPYDKVALHAERQAMRDRINEIEAAIDELGGMPSAVDAPIPEE